MATFRGPVVSTDVAGKLGKGQIPRELEGSTDLGLGDEMGGVAPQLERWIRGEHVVRLLLGHL